MTDVNDMRVCAKCGGRAYGHPWSDCAEFVATIPMRMKVKIDLIVCISQHPTAKLTTDFDGSAELKAFHYNADRNAIELEFG